MPGIRGQSPEIRERDVPVLQFHAGPRGLLLDLAGQTVRVKNQERGQLP